MSRTVTIRTDFQESELNTPLSKQSNGKDTQEHETEDSIHARGHQALISQSPSMARPGL